MPVRADYPAGMPCWIDCITCDPDATREFYGALFGWTFEAEGAGYHLVRHHGEIVGGLGAAPPGRGDQAFWTTYLAAKDLDLTVAGVREFGGTVVMPPMRAGDVGRLFLAVDPGGAAVGFWQGATDEGVVLVDEPGAMVWHELRTTSAAVLGFYRRLFPLAADAPEAGQDVRVTVSGRPGFALHESPEPPRWIPHFGVESVPAARDRATALGARVLSDDAATAYVRDPFGAVLALRAA